MTNKTKISSNTTITNFIHDNPFPEDGEKQTSDLLEKIKDPQLEAEKAVNIGKLFKLQARTLAFISQRCHNYYNLEELYGLAYEALTVACEKYNPYFKVKFYLYYIQTARGLISNYYEYHHEIVHIPVKHQRAGYAHTYGTPDVDLPYNETKHTLSDDLDDLIIDFEHATEITPVIEKELNILKACRLETIKTVADHSRSWPETIREKRNNMIKRLLKFKTSNNL